MKRTALLALACCLIAAPASMPALAAQGGDIGTMEIGRYVCELPGDATGPAGIRQESEDFEILNASSYAVGDVTGSYLLTSDVLVMTSGPRKGLRYRKFSENFLRKLGPDGAESSLRCVRRTRNNR